jgi:predicted TIM-barrel fold metal-dependent hydrolase
MARAVETLETGLRNGISAFWVPSDPPEGRSPAHLDYEPIWARLAEAKVPVMLHLGGGRLLPPAYHENGRPRPTDFLGGGENLRGKDYPAVSHSPENFLNTLVLDGVFQRHENLRCGVIELGATWVPGFIRMLDHAAHAFRKTEPLIAGLELKPSEYIKRQVRFSLFPYEEPGWLIEQSGADLFMFASDFPHPEGGRDPIGSFDKSFEAHATNEVAREKFYSGNFAHMMSMPA